ncbi:NAD-binding protein [Salinigranum marinum]|uniref:NAD-binding protein n=1 Tax=Salinigranum marinum TaxID=1515595 RepID=UPI002989BB42|nr:NAD-binding protein [Salinigranum marinum]
MGWTDVGVDRTVRLTYVVAGLSIAVGLLNASVDFGGIGPIGVLLSQSDRTVLNYTGALSGLALAVSTVAMRRGFRLGWLATVVFLLGTTIQGFFQARVLSLPLTVLSLLSLLLVVRNRRRFHRPFELTAAQRIAGGILLASQLYITVGSYSLRAQFGGIDSLGDAFYFAVVTSATVGYGDITPTTSFARYFAVSAIFVGAGSFAGALGALLQPSLENLFRRSQGRMIESQFQTLEDHVLVLGYGELTESILEGFHDEPSVLVVTDDETVDDQSTAGGVTVYPADPTDDDVLRTARIGTAQAVIVASQYDGPGALAILTARQLNPDVRIVAAATHRENVAKMKRAGADVVISPTNLGGRLLTASALGEVDAEAFEQQLLGDEMEE